MEQQSMRSPGPRWLLGKWKSEGTAPDDSLPSAWSATVSFEGHRAVSICWADKQNHLDGCRQLCLPRKFTKIIENSSWIACQIVVFPTISFTSPFVYLLMKIHIYLNRRVVKTENWKKTKRKPSRKMPWNVSEAYIVSGKSGNSGQVEINYGNNEKIGSSSPLAWLSQEINWVSHGIWLNIIRSAKSQWIYLPNLTGPDKFYTHWIRNALAKQILGPGPRTALAHVSRKAPRGHESGKVAGF